MVHHQREVRNSLKHMPAWSTRQELMENFLVWVWTSRWLICSCLKSETLLTFHASFSKHVQWNLWGSMHGRRWNPIRFVKFIEERLFCIDRIKLFGNMSLRTMVWVFSSFFFLGVFGPLQLMPAATQNWNSSYTTRETIHVVWNNWKVNKLLLSSLGHFLIELTEVDTVCLFYSFTRTNLVLISMFNVDRQII